MQTFFLAVQEKGYFVLNDMLRVFPPEPVPPIENGFVPVHPPTFPSFPLPVPVSRAARLGTLWATAQQWPSSLTDTSQIESLQIPARLDVAPGLPGTLLLGTAPVAPPSTAALPVAAEPETSPAASTSNPVDAPEAPEPAPAAVSTSAPAPAPQVEAAQAAPPKPSPPAPPAPAPSPPANLSWAERAALAASSAATSSKPATPLKPSAPSPTPAPDAAPAAEPAPSSAAGPSPSAAAAEADTGEGDHDDLPEPVPAIVGSSDNAGGFGVYVQGLPQHLSQSELITLLREQMSQFGPFGASGINVVNSPRYGWVAYVFYQDETSRKAAQVCSVQRSAG